MTPRQTVTGFFKNKAEAQQAVQLLLSSGFTAEHVDFLTQADPNAASTKNETLRVEGRSSGRFFSSLFGSSDSSRSTQSGRADGEEPTSHGSTTVVTVRVKSALEVDQAVDLLQRAWEVNVSNEEL